MSTSSANEPQFFSTQVVDARRFYLGTTLHQEQGLIVVSGGRERCRPGYRIDRRGFPYQSIEFVARGSGRLLLDGQDHELVAGSVFAYGPRIAHRITTDADDPMVKYFVDFTGPDARRLLREHGPARGCAVQVASPEAVLRIFDDLVATGTTDGRYTSALCMAIVQQLIFKIAATAVDERAHTSAAFSTYQACREYIREHYLHLRGLDEIADACHVDAAYLCRLFKRFDSQTPYRYLLHLKMSEAARRLQEPGALVKEVAYEFGFRDPFHFSRAFKQVFGLAPHAFRKLR